MNKSNIRSAHRPAAALVVLLALAGCGRAAPEASSTPTTAAPTSSSTTALVATEEPTTTVVAPEPPPIPEPAPVPVVQTTAPPATVTTVKPVVKPSTTTTVQEVAPPTSTVEPAPQPQTTVVVTSHGGPVRDHVSLVDNLRGRGLTVVPVSSVGQPFLHTDGTVLAVSGPGIAATRLQSFDYETAAAAAADAATFGPDGNPRGFMVDWVAPPHLFLRGRVIAIYTGTDAPLLGILTDLMGPQFAGR